MKKTVSIILSLLFVYMSCFGTLAKTDNAPIPTKTLNSITDDFRKALKNGETSVSISKYNVYDDNRGITFLYLFNTLNNMAVSVISYSFGNKTEYIENIVVIDLVKDQTGKMSEIKMKYPERYINEDGKFDLKKFDEDKKLVISRYLEAKNIIRNTMTDVEKALALYDYIVEVIAFAEPDDIDISGNDSYSIYSYMVAGLLLDRRGVCAAYARLYASLLNEVGVHAVTLESREMNHAWVMLCIDGEWYHADPTWDDPVYEKGYTAFLDPNQDNVDEGAVTHNYFLKSDEEIKELEHYDWEISDAVNPDNLTSVPVSGPSGKFSGMFFDSDNEDYLTFSAMCCINGYWYFTDLNNHAIIRTTIDGKPDIIDLPIEDEYPKYTFGYNDNVYFSTNKSVYRFNTLTEKFTRILCIPEDRTETSFFSEMNISFGNMTLVTVTSDKTDGTGNYSFTTDTYAMDDLEIKDAVAEENSPETDTASRNDDSDHVKPAYTKPANVRIDPDTTTVSGTSDGNKSSSFDPIYIIVAAGIVVVVAAGVIIIKKFRR